MNNKADLGLLVLCENCDNAVCHGPCEKYPCATMFNTYRRSTPNMHSKVFTELEQIIYRQRETIKSMALEKKTFVKTFHALVHNLEIGVLEKEDFDILIQAIGLYGLGEPREGGYKNV